MIPKDVYDTAVKVYLGSVSHNTKVDAMMVWARDKWPNEPIMTMNYKLVAFWIMSQSFQDGKESN